MNQAGASITSLLDELECGFEVFHDVLIFHIEYGERKVNNILILILNVFSRPKSNCVSHPHVELDIVICNKGFGTYQRLQKGRE